MPDGPWPVLLAQGEARTTAAAFSPDGRWVAIADAVGAARVVNAADGVTVTELAGAHSDWIHGLEFSSDSGRLLTASADGTAMVWEADTGVKVVGPLAHGRPISIARFSADGGRIVTAGGGLLQVWNAGSGELEAGPWQLPGAVTGAYFGADGRVVHAVTHAGHAAWHTGTGKLVASPPSITALHPAYHASMSPDGRYYAVASTVGLMLTDREEVATPPAGPLAVSQVFYTTFSGDSALLATAGWRAATIWDAGTGQLAVPPLTHVGKVYHAAFSTDGRLLATAAGDGSAQLWETGTGVRVAAGLTHQVGQPATHASFNPDGTRLVTIVGGGAWLWNTSIDGRSAYEMLTTAEVLSASRLSPPGGLTPLSRDDLRERWRGLTGGD